MAYYYDTTITHPIVMRVASHEGKPAGLSDFANAVVTLRNSLKNVWRCTAGSEEMHFDISNLRPGSAVVEVSPAAGFEDIGRPVVSLFESTLEAIENSQPISEKIDYATLHALNGFASLARNREVELSVGRTRLTDQFSANLTKLLTPDSSSNGSVSGRLEEVSIHGKPSFKLFPPIKGESVECFFKKADLQEVAAALGKHVTVYGVLHYAKSKTFPVRVEVSSYEILPETDTLSTLLGACGSLRLASPSVDTIREMRDAWK